MSGIENDQGVNKGKETNDGCTSQFVKLISIHLVSPSVSKFYRLRGTM